MIAWRAPHYNGNVTNTFAIRLTPDGEITVYDQTLSTQFPGTANELITIWIESPEGNYGCCTLDAEGPEANFGVFYGDTDTWRNEGFPFPALENYAMRFYWEPLATRRKSSRLAISWSVSVPYSSLPSRRLIKMWVMW